MVVCVILSLKYGDRWGGDVLKKKITAVGTRGPIFESEIALTAAMVDFIANC